MIHASSIINLLILYGTCQAFFIAFIIVVSKKKTLFKKLFAALLIIEGITLFERLLVETGWIDDLPFLLGIAHPISFLKPPLIFFMALSITQRHFKLSPKKWLHFIPFVLMLLMNLPFLLLSGPEKVDRVKVFMEEVPSYQSFGFYFTLSFLAYIGVYIFLGIKKLNQFRRHVVNNVLVNWYRILLVGYAVFLVFHLIYFLIQPLGEYSFALVNQSSMLAMTFIIQAVAFKLMDQSVLLNAKTPNLTNLKQRKRDEEMLLQKWEVGQIYLDEDLTLEAFANEVSLPMDYVSELINQKFGCSFKKLLKIYRLAEAKKILANSNRTKIKLIDVAYESGFGNKVSFYRAFKELENVSPSEYAKGIKK